jgi:CheY-like chemotaxis protein
MPKLLIIDAHYDIGSMLSVIMKQHGIEAVFVTNTDEARYLLSIDQYHAILYEPGIRKNNNDALTTDHGFDFYQYLIKNHSEIPLLIHTAYADKSYVDKFKQTAAAFLLKPVKIAEMISTVAKCMGDNAVGIKLPQVDPREKIQIFISYARDDQEKAHAIFTLLSHEGYSPWMDTERLLPGQDWKLEIMHAIESSQFFIACFSNNSVTKEGYVQKELKIALDILDEKPFSTIYIIPIRFEDCVAPIKFKKLHWFDMFADHSAAILLKAIKTGCGQRKLLT